MVAKWADPNRVRPRRFQLHRDAVSSIAFSSDDGFLFTCGKDGYLSKLEIAEEQASPRSVRIAEGACMYELISLAF